MKNDPKKKKVNPNPKAIKPEKKTKEDSDGRKAISVDENGAESVATDDSSVIKSDILSLAERLAQKKGKYLKSEVLDKRCHKS